MHQQIQLGQFAQLTIDVPKPLKPMRAKERAVHALSPEVRHCWYSLRGGWVSTNAYLILDWRLLNVSDEAEALRHTVHYRPGIWRYLEQTQVADETYPFARVELGGTAGICLQRGIRFSNGVTEFVHKRADLITLNNEFSIHLYVEVIGLVGLFDRLLLRGKQYRLVQDELERVLSSILRSWIWL
ncbi:MAG: hypothetical protein WHS44_05110 [Fimbriimonadales bacterium]|nr:MAG: hypothetical protein KatS3mg018_2549 [Fimbriimonadales bacterium]